MVTGGDADLSTVGKVLADAGRCAMLLALDDGRALPASRLAAEAGVSRATATTHLNRLLSAGLVVVEPRGRYRYYRLAGPRVGRLIETLLPFASVAPVRSLRQSTLAARLRDARTCYDHVAGRLGVALMAGMLERGYLTGGDGCRADHEPFQGRSRESTYRVSDVGRLALARWGLPESSARRPVSHCIDWTEQRHHLGGSLGTALHGRLLTLGWVRHGAHNRALEVTEEGRRGLAATFAVAD